MISGKISRSRVAAPRRYLDHAALGEGWFVMFDLRKELSWAEKLFTREVEHAGKRIHLVGC